MRDLAIAGSSSSISSSTSYSAAPSMAKVLPLLPAASTSSSSSVEQKCQGLLLLGQQRQAVYTVWMKSLVFNGNGCTVYGADGGVAFRVDNYGCRGGREVFFMDCAGRGLIRVQRKSFGVFKRWEACRCFDDDDGLAGVETMRPWFKVKKQALKKNAAIVTMHDGSGRTYVIDGCARKSDYKIRGAGGDVVAAVGRKQTASGVVLGEDVLTLTVGSGAEHLFVLGVVIVCGLMNRCL